jgi:hypothetical protein
LDGFWSLISGEAHCHTRFSEENQMLNYMYARIKFHTYSDIIVNNRNNIT